MVLDFGIGWFGRAAEGERVAARIVDSFRQCSVIFARRLGGGGSGAQCASRVLSGSEQMRVLNFFFFHGAMESVIVNYYYYTKLVRVDD